MSTVSGAEIVAEELTFDVGAVAFEVAGGNYLPALHRCLTSGALPLGEARTFEVPAAEAFGEKDPRMGPLTVPANRCPPGMKAGDLAGLENGMTARVVSADDAAVVIDANHALALSLIHI